MNLHLVCRTHALGTVVALCLYLSAQASAQVVLNPANGHYYERIDAPNITWDAARAGAESRSYRGVQGHLATLATQQENEFIHQRGSTWNWDWIGGVQAAGSPEPSEGWTWITGEPWSFTLWGPGEPNNGFGDEDALQWVSASGYPPSGGWNDRNRNNSVGTIYGYIVEYDGPFLPALIAQYDFVASGGVIPDGIAAAPNHDLIPQPNGASLGQASQHGCDPITHRLGAAGVLSEPVEPAPDNNYGFWVSKDLLMSLPNWSLLLWFSRDDFENDDFLFYIGTGDGGGGTGAETYVYGDTAGQVHAVNFRSNSAVDMNIGSGPLQPGTWYQMGLVRQGSGMSLYLNGALLGTVGDVLLNSFGHTSNSVIVLGAAKWMRLPHMRLRVLDGMIDQVEVYDHAMSTAEVQARYAAVTGSQLHFRGDANCDGLTDFFDIDALLLALFDRANYAPAFCNGSVCTVDANCDGLVDFADIDPFLECIFGPCPSCP